MLAIALYQGKEAPIVRDGSGDGPAMTPANLPGVSYPPSPIRP